MYFPLRKYMTDPRAASRARAVAARPGRDTAVTRRRVSSVFGPHAPAADLAIAPAGLAGDLEVRELPAAVESGSFGAVDPEVHEPADAGKSLNPAAVVYPVRARPGSEVQPDRLLRRQARELEHGPDRGLVLLGPDLAAGARVVDSERPEQRGRDWLWHVEGVAPGSV